ncbi:MAG TPA: F0F1 ATP synthase subunit alpha, partial [Gemmataceae bacterium]|nr:F0F1 ATP synthase subunit alpha [Gemmataceae bacterium]
GYRMVEVLKQPQYKPMNVIDQVMVIYAATKGYLDKVPVGQVAAWEEQLLRFMNEQKADVRKALLQERKLRVNAQKEPDDDRLNAAIQAFVKQFKA